MSNEEVESLEVGDAIYSHGKEIPVNSIERDVFSVSINGGSYEYEEGTLWLVEDSTADRNYRPMDYNDYLWTSLAEIDVPVSDSLLFLDDIDTDGSKRPLPAVYTAGEFLRILKQETLDSGVGFTTNNVPWRWLRRSAMRRVVRRRCRPSGRRLWERRTWRKGGGGVGSGIRGGRRSRGPRSRRGR